ncbi:MAG: hypothetical protein M3214_13010 [Actinomycetota bacterium]|jgi:hypothetical protein|nr:hypothetical protein [Actinomycetota bacterium]
MDKYPEYRRSGRVFCSSCGATDVKRHGLLPLGWQEMPDVNNRCLSLCPHCVRRNLWLIEARLELDSELGF